MVIVPVIDASLYPSSLAAELLMPIASESSMANELLTAHWPGAIFSTRIPKWWLRLVQMARTVRSLGVSPAGFARFGELPLLWSPIARRLVLGSSRYHFVSGTFSSNLVLPPSRCFGPAYLRYCFEKKGKSNSLRSNGTACSARNAHLLVQIRVFIRRRHELQTARLNSPFGQLYEDDNSFYHYS